MNIDELWFAFKICITTALITSSIGIIVFVIAVR